jgi:hypothetical protein
MFTSVMGSLVAPPNVVPMRSTRIPGAMTVVRIPIAVDGELDDRNADARRVLQQRNVPIAIVVLEIVGRHPAAHVSPGHVAPAVAAHTRVHVDLPVVGNHADNRELRSWTRPHIEVRRDDGVGRRRRRRQESQAEDSRSQMQEKAFHEVCSVFWVA